MPIITPEEMGGYIPALSTKYGQKLTRFLFRVLSLNKFNDVYDKVAGDNSPDSAASFLKEIGAHYEIGNKDRLDSLPEGPFITICNHPYGHIDGVIMIDIFGHLRSDYKVMVNSLLGHVRALEQNFIKVVPTGDVRTTAHAQSIMGVKQVLSNISEGGSVGFFPSGAVSDLSLKDRCVRDRQWQEPALKLIRRAHVPIVPVRFFDGNSWFYYSLGLISSYVRVLRLPAEALNKEGKRIRVGIGETIDLVKQESCATLEEFSSMLRSSVYDMPLPEELK